MEKREKGGGGKLNVCRDESRLKGPNEVSFHSKQLDIKKNRSSNFLKKGGMEILHRETPGLPHSKSF